MLCKYRSAIDQTSSTAAEGETIDDGLPKMMEDAAAPKEAAQKTSKGSLEDAYVADVHSLKKTRAVLAKVSFQTNRALVDMSVATETLDPHVALNFIHNSYGKEFKLPPRSSTEKGPPEGGFSEFAKQVAERVDAAAQSRIDPAGSNNVVYILQIQCEDEIKRWFSTEYPISPDLVFEIFQAPPQKTTEYIRSVEGMVVSLRLSDLLTSLVFASQ